MTTKYYYHYILFTYFAHSVMANNVKRFVVVSEAYQDIYPIVAKTGPVARQEELEIDEKKQICEDITSTYLFHRLREGPYEKRASRFTRSIKRFKYPNKLLPVTLENNEGVVEKAFICMTRRGRSDMNYYISDEYNLNIEASEDKNASIAGRFIFYEPEATGRKWLFGVAEVPARVSESSHGKLETLYLSRRAKNTDNWARTDEEDDLCRLGVEDRHRICMAVFTSDSFASTIRLSPAVRFEGLCKLRTVSFQTQPASRLKEWMLNCKPSDSDTIFGETRYLLSHANESNEIFVFSHENNGVKGIFLHSLMSHVRIEYSAARHKNLNFEYVDSVQEV